ncbi:MAG: hypothetical protein Rsou_0228 [Candidatus Ruthia sp. Asou_11_S2]|nr:hypothetical protein [Candidatus Ruthia sp. Asou_11_S2]
MFGFWQQNKLSYLRNHNRLDLDSMRRFNLPNQMIKQTFLDEIKKDLSNHFE